MKRYFEKNTTDKKNFVKKGPFLSIKEQNLRGCKIFTKGEQKNKRNKKKKDLFYS